MRRHFNTRIIHHDHREPEDGVKNIQN